LARPIAVLVALAGVLAGCDRAVQDLQVEFVAAVNGRQIACGQSVQGIELSDLRFYVSDIALLAANGESVPASLVANGRWQGNGLALIDLEDGSGDCLNGTPDTNAMLRARVPAADYRSLLLTVGVPFSLNHSDPLLAQAPLNDSTMHWHWRSGYKFFRAGLVTDGDSVSVHLGSAGCEGRVNAISGCRFPNRFRVQLDNWLPGMPVKVDMTALLSATDLRDGEPVHCTSGPAEEDCAGIFPVFGIDFFSGESAGGQALLRIDDR
jgi:uncharacterized repeat protein (TIGR04052 family)